MRSLIHRHFPAQMLSSLSMINDDGISACGRLKCNAHSNLASVIRPYDIFVSQLRKLLLS